MMFCGLSFIQVPNKLNYMSNNISHAISMQKKVHHIKIWISFLKLFHGKLKKYLLLTYTFFNVILCFATFITQFYIITS